MLHAHRTGYGSAVPAILLGVLLFGPMPSHGAQGSAGRSHQSANHVSQVGPFAHATRISCDLVEAVHSQRLDVTGAAISFPGLQILDGGNLFKVEAKIPQH